MSILDHSGRYSAASEDENNHQATTAHIANELSSSYRESSSTFIIPPTARTNASSQELTLDKLQFETLGIHGREYEMNVLSDCLESLVRKQSSSSNSSALSSEHITTSNKRRRRPSNHNNTQNKKQVVFLSGPSGSGKSALTSTLTEHARRKHAQGIQFRGKFEQFHSRDKPFSGILSASEDLCREFFRLRRRYKSIFQNLKEELSAAFGSELQEIFRLFPKLELALMEDDANDVERQEEDALSCRSNQSRSSTHTGSGSKSTTTQYWMDRKSAFSYLFRVFMGVVCRTIQPVVFILDDLQWADAASLEALETLIRDHDNHNILVIGIYRSNEVNEAHLLTEVINDVKAKDQSLGADVTELSIGNLTVNAVNQVVQALLRTDNDTATMPLAELCHQKTLGNPFYLIHYLGMLEERKLLQYSLGLLKWTWDNETIRNATQASDNVVDLLMTQMLQQPAEIQQTLPLAAFLGCSFEVNTLELVWNFFRVESGNENSKVTDLREALVVCENIGFIKSCGEMKYSWVHDSIQEAAFALIEETERRDMGWRIGEILSAGLQDDEYEDSIFTIATLLNNRGPSTSHEGTMDPDIQLELCTINLKAAKRAVGFSAFDSAAKYIERGIDLLPNDAWEKHYDLALEMYSVGANVENSVGDMEQMEDYCAEIIHQGQVLDKPILDMLPAYNALTQGRFNQQRHAEAFDICVLVLSRCGCQLPSGKFSIIVTVISNLLQVKKTVASRTRDEIDELPVLEDEMRIHQMRLLDKLATSCYFVEEKKSFLPIVVTRSLNYTLRYGLCEYSPPAFATTGVILAGVLGDFQGGAVYANYALHLLDRVPNARQSASRTIMVTHALVLFWTTPALSLCKPLLRGYEMGLKSGDTESATFCIRYYMFLSFLAGKSLESLERDFLVYTNQMRQLQRDTVLFLCNCTWQTILNLMGKSENTVELSGEAIDDKEWEATAATSSMHNSVLYNHRLILRSFFGDYQYCADTALEWRGRCQKQFRSSPVLHFDLFHRALGLFAMARSTGKRKYKKEAIRVAAQIKSWVKRGSPNVRHLDKLLDAEHAAMKKKTRLAKQYYQ